MDSRLCADREQQGSRHRLHDLIPMVKYHHEHWDGTGYPERLKGEEIPYTARIVSIADAFHALVSDRPYRKGLGVEKACEILKLGAGIQWERRGRSSEEVEAERQQFCQECELCRHPEQEVKCKETLVV